jgi:hypothetical protein
MQIGATRAVFNQTHSSAVMNSRWGGGEEGWGPAGPLESGTPEPNIGCHAHDFECKGVPESILKWERSGKSKRTMESIPLCGLMVFMAVD